MKHVVVTGAGSGLGKALAIRYAKEGHYVYLLGRDDQKLIVAKKEIEEFGGKADHIVCDVTEPASIEEAGRQFEHVDVLINNAGIGHFGPIQDYTIDQIDVMLDTNIKGTILMTQAFLPKIEKTNGRILNIISTAGLRGKVNESVYCASKFAQRGFTESLQKEWETKNVTVTAVYMGGMNTPFWDESNHVANPEKLMSPDEVADFIYTHDDGRLEITIERKK